MTFFPRWALAAPPSSSVRGRRERGRTSCKRATSSSCYVHSSWWEDAQITADLLVSVAVVARWWMTPLRAALYWAIVDSDLDHPARGGSAVDELHLHLSKEGSGRGVALLACAHRTASVRRH